MAMFYLISIVLSLTYPHFGDCLCPHPTGSLHTLPGLDGTLGHGYDLTTFAFPIHGAVAKSSAGACVVNMTANGQMQYTDEYANNTNFLIWDQVDYVSLSNYEIQKCTLAQFDTFFAYQESLEVSVSDGGLFGLFSSSASFSEYLSFGFSNNMSFVSCHGLAAAYSIHLREVSLLEADADFLNDVMSLPNAWSDALNWPKWTDHFATYGTHFAQTGFFGGGFFYDSFIDSAYASASAGGDLSLNANLDFLRFLWADGSGYGQGSAAASAYVQASHSSVNCYGAMQFAAGCNNQRNDSALWDEWFDAIVLAPAMYDARFYMNARLIQAPLVRVNHIMATTAYIGWAGIDLLHTMLGILANYLEGILQMTDDSCKTDPKCHWIPESSHQGLCFRLKADVYSHVMGNASSLYNRTQQVLTAINNATAQKATSLKLPDANVLLDWAAAVKNISTSIFLTNTNINVCEAAIGYIPVVCCWEDVCNRVGDCTFQIGYCIEDCFSLPDLQA